MSRTALRLPEEWTMDRWLWITDEWYGSTTIRCMVSSCFSLYKSKRFTLLATNKYCSPLFFIKPWDSISPPHSVSREPIACRKSEWRIEEGRWPRRRWRLKGKTHSRWLTVYWLWRNDMIKLSTMTLRLSRSEDKQRMNTGIEIRKSHRLKEVIHLDITQEWGIVTLSRR